MLNKKEKRVLVTLDTVELVLLFVGLVLFTVIFKLVEEPMRYLFLVGDAYIVYASSKTLTNLEELISKKEKKQNTKVVTEVSI